MPYIAACMTLGLLTGGDITVGGERPVVVYVPPSYDPDIPMPLLIALHGYFDSNYIEDSWNLTPIAASRGLLYAYPSGTVDCRGLRFWNATPACCNICGSGVDDSAYLRGIIEETGSVLNVDPERVYVIGHSNGGFMSYRMACDHSDVVAAIVSVAGASHADPAECMPVSGVHVLQVHGTADYTIRYDGGTLASFFGLPDPGARPYPGAVASVEDWAGHDGCSLSAAPAPPLDLDLTITGPETSVIRYADGCREDGSAELWTIKYGSHSPDLGPESMETIVDWLLKHPKGIPTRAGFSVRPSSGLGPMEVLFDGSESTAVEGAAIISYVWDFGDRGTGTGKVSSHVYENPGRYLATLTIRTDTGQVDVSGRMVTLLCPPSEEVSPWIAKDIGDPDYSGSVRRCSDGNNCLHICAGGADLSTMDRLFFVYQELHGAVQLSASIVEVDGVANSFLGLMLREGSSPTARFATVGFERGSALDAEGVLRLRFRLRDGRVPSTRLGMRVPSLPCYIRLEREGEAVRAFGSLNAVDWTQLGEAVLPDLSDALLSGVAAYAKDTGGAPFSPLRAYIGAGVVEQAPVFHRADPNSSGTADISDGIAIFSYLFLVDPPVLSCLESADTNNDAVIDISDGIAILQWLFENGPEPAPPGPPEPERPCGPDADPFGSTGDLGCVDYGFCS